MNFVCAKSALVTGVRLAGYALGTRTSMPILGGVKLTVRGESLELYATDLERALSCTVPIKNSGPDGSTVLNGSVFVRIAQHLPEDEEIQIKGSDSDSTVVHLSCGETSFDLPTLPVEDYPEAFSLPDTKVAALEAAKFHRALEQTSFAALKAGETTRLSLTGVAIVLKDGAAKLVATNGYRLSLKTIDVTEILEEGEFLVEAGVLGDLDRVLSQLGVDEVVLFRGEGQLYFQAGDVVFMAKTIAEEFPDFERVIPKDNPIALSFNRRALYDTLQRMAITAAEESGAVTVRASSEETAVRISSSSKDKGEGEERVRLATAPESDIDVAFKAEYLLDALKRMDSEEIALHLSSSDKAGLIEPSGDPFAEQDAGFLYVCMPVRLTS